MKVCKTCKCAQPINHFYNSRNPEHSDGKQPRCITCQNKRRDANTFKKDHPDLTEAEFRSMYNKQRGKCRACQDPVDIDKVHIDHDHSHCGPKRSCKECRRALLCRECNISLGIMREDTRRIENLALYSHEVCGAKTYTETEELNDIRITAQPLVLQPTGRVQQSSGIGTKGAGPRYARIRNYRPWKSNRA